MTERERIIAGFSPSERDIYRGLTGKGPSIYSAEPGDIRPYEPPPTGHRRSDAPLMDAPVVSVRRVKRGPKPYPVERVDTGEWWPDAGEAAAAIGMSRQSVIAACRLGRTVRSLRLKYSEHKTRPERAASAA